MNIRYLIESDDIDDPTSMLDRMTAPISLNHVIDLLSKQGFHPEFPEKQEHFWLIRCIGHPYDINKYLIQQHIHGALCSWTKDKYPGQRWNRTLVTFQRGQAYWTKKDHFGNNIYVENANDLDRYVDDIPWSFASALAGHGFHAHDRNSNSALKAWPIDPPMAMGDAPASTFNKVTLYINAQNHWYGESFNTYFVWEIEGNIRKHVHEFCLPQRAYQEALKLALSLLPIMERLGMAASKLHTRSPMDYDVLFHKLPEFEAARAAVDKAPPPMTNEAQQIIESLLEADTDDPARYLNDINVAGVYRKNWHDTIGRTLIKNGFTRTENRDNPEPDYWRMSQFGDKEWLVHLIPTVNPNEEQTYVVATSTSTGVTKQQLSHVVVSAREFERNYLQHILDD